MYEKEVMHVIGVLLAGAHYFIPTSAVAKAGRRMMLFPPLQLSVLQNDKNSLWSSISALS